VNESTSTGGPCGANPGPHQIPTSCQPSKGSLAIQIAQDTAATTMLTFSGYPGRSFSYPGCQEYDPEGVNQQSLTPIPAKMPRASALFSRKVRVIHITASRTFSGQQTVPSIPSARIDEHATVDWKITLRRM
jgi:hypothetical protein